MVTFPRTKFSDPWHYERRELAKAVYKTLVSNVAPAVRLFQPRRTGKSQFLLRDLGPYAIAQGNPVAFTNLQESETPIEAIYNDILEAKKKPGKTTQEARWIKKIELAMGVKGKLFGGLVEGHVEGKAEFEKSPETLLPKHQSIEFSNFDKLDAALVGFGTERKPGILLLDEFQVLGEHCNAKDILARFKQILENHSSRLRVVFTGSSVEKLNAIFVESKNRRHYDRPFANFASNVPWEQFDKGFVEHLRKVYKAEMKKILDIDELLAFFDSVERNPEIMRWLFSSLTLDSEQSVNGAGSSVIDEMGRNHGWDIIWENSSPLRRVVLRMIADGQVDITGSKGRARYRELSGQEPNKATISNAIRFFSITDSIPVERPKRGTTVITDHTFRIWLRLRELQDLRIM